MKPILWMSQHPPLQAQVDWLNKRFGNVTVEQDPNPFDTADVIVERFKGYDDIVVVAPLSVIDQLIRRGIKPIWAEMKEVSVHEARMSPNDSVVVKGKRGYRFINFRRIVAIEFKYEEL